MPYGESMRVVIESPLAGDTVKNLRYALWCCRYAWVTHREHAIASHMLCPWFMDDEAPAERAAGINWGWMWSKEVPHVFFTDLGWSGGMKAAYARCRAEEIPTQTRDLATPAMWDEAKAETLLWDAFHAGEWPPHTKGFEIGGTNG